MKRIFTFYNALLLGILLSCGTTKEIAPVVEDSAVIKGKALKTLFGQNGSDSSTCVISYSYFEEGIIPYRDTVNQKIKSYVSLITQFSGKTKNDAKLSFEYVNAQLDSFELIYKDEVEAEIYHLWELESVIEIDDTHDDFVQLQLSAWSFTGGAHGNGSTTTYIIDKSTGHQLLLKDFFSDPKAVTDIAEACFRKLYELEDDTSLEDAGFWFEDNVFYLNNNFSIVGDKIVFLFNTYEIAPYAAGETVIEIPIEEINSFIKVKI